jgi:hypothetical protein
MVRTATVNITVDGLLFLAPPATEGYATAGTPDPGPFATAGAVSGPYATSGATGGPYAASGASWGPFATRGIQDGPQAERGN